MQKVKADSFDDYLLRFSGEIQDRLKLIRETVLAAYPQARESIRYDMPSFEVNGIYIYVAAYKKHIGIYPMYANTKLEEEVKRYRGNGTKDALHFLHSDELPLEVIRKIVRQRFEGKDR